MKDATHTKTEGANIIIRCIFQEIIKKWESVSESFTYFIKIKYKALDYRCKRSSKTHLKELAQHRLFVNTSKYLLLLILNLLLIFSLKIRVYNNVLYFCVEHKWIDVKGFFCLICIKPKQILASLYHLQTLHYELLKRLWCS